MTDLGVVLDQQVTARLLSLPGIDSESEVVTQPIDSALSAQTEERQGEIKREISQRNAQFFAEEADKLDGWEQRSNLSQREIKELDRQIKEARRSATSALTLEEKLSTQEQIRNLESQRNDKRRSLFDAQDKVDKQREDLIASIEGKLKQTVTLKRLFTIRWQLRDHA